MELFLYQIGYIAIVAYFFLKWLTSIYNFPIEQTVTFITDGERKTLKSTWLELQLDLMKELNTITDETERKKRIDEAQKKNPFNEGVIYKLRSTYKDLVFIDFGNKEEIQQMKCKRKAELIKYKAELKELNNLKCK